MPPGACIAANRESRSSRRRTVSGSCIVLFVGVVVGLYARSGMAINSHPYETMLLPRRPRRRDAE
jgi:hypothetical protein